MLLVGTIQTHNPVLPPSYHISLFCVSLFYYYLGGDKISASPCCVPLHQSAEESLLLVSNEKLKQEYCYISWLTRYDNSSLIELSRKISTNGGRIEWNRKDESNGEWNRKDKSRIIYCTTIGDLCLDGWFEVPGESKE